MLAAYIAAPYADEEIKDLQKFMPLKWDKIRIKVETPEEKAKREAMFRKWDEQMKANG